MLKLNQLIFIPLTIINFACSDNSKNSKLNIQRILIDDVYAEGEISKDSVLNGLIKFYDTSTNQIVLEAFYKDGIINGKRIDYHSSGKIKNIGYYNYGKQHGALSYFDSAGNLEQKENYYFDLKVGSSIEYKDDKPTRYFFSTFDREILFDLKYDTIEDKLIDKINNNSFFFWKRNNIDVFESPGIIRKKKQYFIYLINPPEFHFKYSLCIINDQDSVLTTLQNFDPLSIFATFSLDSTIPKEGQRYSLKLTFDRGSNEGIGEKGSMLKRL